MAGKGPVTLLEERPRDVERLGGPRLEVAADVEAVDEDCPVQPVRAAVRAVEVKVGVCRGSGDRQGALEDNLNLEMDSQSLHLLNIYNLHTFRILGA